MDGAKAIPKARIEHKVIRRDGTQEVVLERFVEGKEAQAVWEKIKGNFEEEKKNG